MTRELTDIELLRELEPVAEDNVNRHLSMAKDWHPHDYVPWDDGRNFAALGGVDWDPEQSALSETAKAAMITNLLTEDNLPSYHREIAEHFGFDGAWGTWVGRWTAEENKHSVVMRDYLVVTRGVDPVALENARMEHMTNGFAPGATSMLDSVSYVTFQELATRVSHRNTGKACGDPIADRMLARVAADENLHMMFYRNIVEGALDIAPDQALHAVVRVLTNFQMPGASMANFRRNAVLIAKGGIYDLRQHLDEVVQPVLRKWRIFERTDFGARGEDLREQLDTFLVDLEAQAVRFEESRDRALARQARRGQEVTA
ncbi:acyl-ACP desaturase [Rhodococcus zopfii]|uniref:Acyl-ACP desaturase n=1 Tax=Rhodococcus zopfii TaxID=43772 RepID=A0ABU3WRI4_9NOCA|nr:acyl-ACP desaturase [Rhodococcus zopfii]MDV2476591.1 acyl-ACP desaturase [Rhodococcus zopfii]